MHTPVLLRPESPATATPASSPANDTKPVFRIRALIGDEVKPAPAVRRFALRDTPNGPALVEVSGEPGDRYVVRIATAQVVTVRETVTESFVVDEDGEGAIVRHAPRVETRTRTIYGAVEVSGASVAEVEAVCWRAMNRPHGVGTIGDLALPIARGDEGPVEPVAISVRRIVGGEAQPVEVVRVARRGGVWAIETGDALANALARARVEFEAARAARIAAAAPKVEAPETCEAQPAVEPATKATRTPVPATTPEQPGLPLLAMARSLGSDLPPAPPSSPLAATGSRRRRPESVTAAAVGRQPRKGVQTPGGDL